MGGKALRPRNVGHPGTLAERVHAVPQGAHGRGGSFRRRDGHHLLWKAYTEEAGARFDFWVRCPHCGFFQHMEFERIAWPGKDEEKSPDAETVLAKRLATYARALWDGVGRRRPRLGRQERGVARARVRARTHGPYPHAPVRRRAVGGGPRGPRGAVSGPVDEKARVSVLLATVDTQQHYFRYVIRAYGYGETEESWLVSSGSADNLAALEEILFGSVYVDPDGREYAVGHVMIDAMGGRTAEVYRWAVRHRGRVFPWQGVRSMAQPYTPSHQEYFPDARGNKVKIPGGLMLYRCDVTFFKSDLAFKLGIHPDWDCEVMQRALAYILNVRHRRRPDEQQKKPARPPRPAERGGIGSRPAGLRRY